MPKKEGKSKEVKNEKKKKLVKKKEKIKPAASTTASSAEDKKPDKKKKADKDKGMVAAGSKTPPKKTIEVKEQKKSKKKEPESSSDWPSSTGEEPFSFTTSDEDTSRSGQQQRAGTKNKQTPAPSGSSTPKASKKVKIVSKPKKPKKQEPPESSSEMWSEPKKSEVMADVKAMWNVLSALQEAEGSTITDSPDWSKPTVEATVFLMVAKGEVDPAPVGPNIRCMDELVLAGILEQFALMSLERVHHFALNGEYMYGLYRDKKLVDMLIHVQERIFYGHRNILCTHSGYFSSILMDNDVPPYKVTDVTLLGIEPDLFQHFLHFAYTGDIFVTTSNLAPLKNIARALQSPSMQARLLLFMSKLSLMSLPDALYILCNHIDIEDKALALEVVKIHFKELLEDVESLGKFSFEDMQELVSSPNLCVNSELDVFWVVLYWVAKDPVGRINQLNQLMKQVRFTTMSSLELVDCAKVSELVRLSKPCKTLLISANWVCHSRELGVQDPFGLPHEEKRNCLMDKKRYEPTVAEFDKRFLVYTMLMQKNGGTYFLDS